VFLGTEREARWAFIDGPRTFRPDLYEAFISHLPAADRPDPLAAYVARLTDPDSAARVPAAHIWFQYERALSELAPAKATLTDKIPEGTRIPPTPIVEAHYIRHNFFLAPDQLIANAHRLKGIPGVIVQGRYDLLCPPRSAYGLASAWPDVRLQIIDNAGHAMTEPGVMDAMRAAIVEIQR
jgi:proline iminopeptidase